MIAVIGDFMIDHYLWGKSERISPEAPVPVVEIEKEEDRLGGAGNVVNNLLALNAKVLPVGVLGKDANRILDILKNKNVPTEGLFIDPNRQSIIKSRIIATNQQVLRYDKESKEYIKKEFEDKILEFIKQNLDNISIFLHIPRY